MKATLQKVLTKDAFDRMIPMAERWTDGVAKAIYGIRTALERDPPRLPRRYLFAREHRATAPKRTTPWISNWSALCISTRMNRGILLTPFHNMALMSPVTRRKISTSTRKLFGKRPRSWWGRERNFPHRDTEETENNIYGANDSGVGVV